MTPSHPSGAEPHDLGRGLQADSPTQTYSGRYVVRGGSHSITVPPPLRRKFKMRHGDYVIWLVVGDVMRCRVVRPEMILRGEFWEGKETKTSEAK